MIRVQIIDLDVGVCEERDINSVFKRRNIAKFCERFQDENNDEQERKGRRRVEEWLIAGHHTKWEPETVRCQNCYRFILYPLPWDLPHIHPLQAEQKRGERYEKVWAPSHRSNGARGLVKEAYKDEWEMEDRRARGLALGRKRQHQLGLI